MSVFETVYFRLRGGILLDLCVEVTAPKLFADYDEGVLKPHRARLEHGVTLHRVTTPQQHHESRLDLCECARSHVSKPLLLTCSQTTMEECWSRVVILQLVKNGRHPRKLVR